MSQEKRHPVPLTPMRQAIARRMSQSKQQIPHVYEMVDIEMDRALRLVADTNAGRASDERVTVTGFLVWALAHTLVAHPQLNAVWNGEVLELLDAVNIGVAIEVPDGLLAPAILDCETRDLESTSSALRDLIARTRAGKIKAREWSDATFSLSNLGTSSVSQFTAIIVPPQVAILATARTSQRPVARDGVVTIRSMMTATISADHRALDGAVIARFLDSLKQRIEGGD